ncbi:MAG: hypothetical protein V2I43_17140 [Parvularcula sp.]|jgi:hypothetical protein|nr:hypothetical protein [Parvularcula sp.]
MTQKKNIKQVFVNRPDKPMKEGARNADFIGGAMVEEFNNRLLSDVLASFWRPQNDTDQSWMTASVDMSLHSLIGIAPKNEHEGMLAGQIVASYAATMECFRRAAINDQYPASRKDNLNLANKSARTFATLTETLLKLRGETGKQSVHVHHHHHDSRTQVAARNATVNFTTWEGGEAYGKSGQPHERGCGVQNLRHSPEESFNDRAALRGPKSTGEPVPLPRDER